MGKVKHGHKWVNIDGGDGYFDWCCFCGTVRVYSVGGYGYYRVKARRPRRRGK